MDLVEVGTSTWPLSTVSTCRNVVWDKAVEKKKCPLVLTAAAVVIGRRAVDVP
jgi:hypothetical protein